MIESTEEKYVGTWILGQYRIERMLDSGGMGTVYLAKQASMDRNAAVKILHSVAKTDEKQGRFRKEARAASRLMHPNIVTVYNFGELADGSLFLAMEYVDGTSLEEIIGHEALPLLQAIRVTQQCADALGYAHGKQVIHRDFKPSNIIITQLQGGDHVKVLDFGLARLVGETTITQSGTLIGTPRYMAPEQWQCHTITDRVDQYTLGQVFWEMLTGQALIDSPWPMECMNKHLNETPPLPSKLRQDPGLELLDPVVAKMMAKDPAERFESMQQLSELLRQAELQLEQAQQGGEIRPLAELPARESDRDAAGQTMTIKRSDSVVSLREDPASLALLGQEVVAKEGSGEVLELHGLNIQGHYKTPGELAVMTERPDLYVLGLPQRGWEAKLDAWCEAGLPLDQTLVSIHTDNVSAELTGAVDRCASVLVGPHPPEPLALAAALSWIRWNDSGGIELIWPDQTIQLRQLTAASHKSAYVDDLLDDIRAEGFRQRTLRALGELSEEMISSAFFRGSLSIGGDTRQSQVIHQARELSGGDEVTLRWVITERFVGLSVRDPFGALSPQQIVAGIAGSASEGPAMGARIMFQAARHLFFAICPGTWSEVLALVEREPAGRGDAGGHTLCLLQGLGQRARKIGDRLALDEVKSQDLMSIALKGEINETSDFRSIFRHSGQVILDMAEVTRINSMGIQTWIEAARNASDELELIFDRCSLAVVSQLNMIPKFASTGRVSSIQAPYFCAGCETEVMELLTLDEIIDKQPPRRHCSDCQEELEFDELPEVYFSFLEKLPS